MLSHNFSKCVVSGKKGGGVVLWTDDFWWRCYKTRFSNSPNSSTSSCLPLCPGPFWLFNTCSFRPVFFSGRFPCKWTIASMPKWPKKTYRSALLFRWLLGSFKFSNSVLYACPGCLCIAFSTSKALGWFLLLIWIWAFCVHDWHQRTGCRFGVLATLQTRGPSWSRCTSKCVANIIALSWSCPIRADLMQLVVLSSKYPG